MILRRHQIGLSDRAVARAVREGRLIRLRRGWYAAPTLDPQLRRAAGSGGHLACVSALEARGVWTLPHSLHIMVSPGTPPAAGVIAHVGRSEPIQGAAEALRCFARCGSELEVVVAADSAIDRGILTLEQVGVVLGATVRGRRLLTRVDTAESGIESIARLRLRARGVRLRSQVRIGRFRVDLLVGERLVIELDGQRWHDTASSFEEDRRRDAELVAQGYLVLRFSFRRIMDDWPAVEQQILTVIRRGDHRARGRHAARSTESGHPTPRGAE